MIERSLIALPLVLLVAPPALAASHQVRVPRVTGQTLLRAERNIRRAHLRVGRITYITRRTAGVIATTPRAGRKVRRNTRIAIRDGVVVVKRALVPKKPPPAPDAFSPPLIGSNNEGSCINNEDPGPWARAHGSSVVKVGIADNDYEWPGQPPRAYGCLQQAQAEGFRIYLTIVLPRVMPVDVAGDIAFAKVRIAKYAPLHPWAISLGNEQELYGMTGQQYRQIWDAVEPSIAAAGSLPVFAEATPWGFTFVQNAWGNSNPVGVAALAMHFYHTSIQGLAIMPEIAAWAKARGVPLWDSESSPNLTDPWMGFVMESLTAYNAYLDAQLRASENNVRLVVRFYWPHLGGVN